MPKILDLLKNFKIVACWIIVIIACIILIAIKRNEYSYSVIIMLSNKFLFSMFLMSIF